MDSESGQPLDRWSDPTLTGTLGWTDYQGRSPVTLYREYLIRRREWEVRAWRAGGSQTAQFGRLLQDLGSLHGDLSSPAPVDSRDRSIAKPPSRDYRAVKVVSVEWHGDHVELRTLEEEFEGLLPVPYRVVIDKYENRWRLTDRVTGIGRGRPIRRL